MLVAERDSAGIVRTIADLSQITRLGRGVDSSRQLDSESAAQTLAAITEFAQKARDLGVEKIVAVATAALRDVRDGAEFIAKVTKDTPPAFMLCGQMTARPSRSSCRSCLWRCARRACRLSCTSTPVWGMGLGCG